MTGCMRYVWPHTRKCVPDVLARRHTRPSTRTCNALRCCRVLMVSRLSLRSRARRGGARCYRQVRSLCPPSAHLIQTLLYLMAMGCTGRGEARGSRELCACAGRRMLMLMLMLWRCTMQGKLRPFLRVPTTNNTSKATKGDRPPLSRRPRAAVRRRLLKSGPTQTAQHCNP